MEWLEEKIAQEFEKDKWEVKTLGEIVTSEILLGSQEINNLYKSDGAFPAITCGDLFASNVFIKNCTIFVNETLYTSQPKVEKGDLLLIYNGVAAEKLGTSLVYLGESTCVAGRDMVVIKHTQNPKYLSYIFASQYVKKQIRNLFKGAGRTRLWKNDIKQIKIPLPDLKAQNRIAEFLDGFIGLERELQKEMEKRDIQYEYYKELIANIGTSNHEMVRSKDISGVQEGQMRSKNSGGNHY